MSQHDMNIANADGATVRADINSALVALAGLSSGPAEPATAFAYQMWADTTTGLLKIRNGANSAWVTVGTMASANLGHLVGSDIGVSVQAYDVDTAKLDADQSWTGSQRGAITTDNDLSFDLNAANNFTCTPTAGGTLTFTNITAGQSGFIKLVNGSNYAIAAHANTKVTTTFLTTVSATGTYIISYYSDGTNVFCATAGAMA